MCLEDESGSGINGRLFRWFFRYSRIMIENVWPRDLFGVRLDAQLKMVTNLVTERSFEG